MLRLLFATNVDYEDDLTKTTAMALSKLTLLSTNIPQNEAGREKNNNEIAQIKLSFGCCSIIFGVQFEIKSRELSRKLVKTKFFTD